MNIVDLLIKHEGMRLKPYKCPAGKWTIGVGRNIEDNGITRREGMVLLNNDIARVIDELGDFYWYKKLQTRRQHALIDMCFNLGITRFKKFKKMIKALEEKNYDKAADEMLDSRWSIQVGDRAQELAEMMR